MRGTNETVGWLGVLLWIAFGRTCIKPCKLKSQEMRVGVCLCVWVERGREGLFLCQKVCRTGGLSEVGLCYKYECVSMSVKNVGRFIYCKMSQKMLSPVLPLALK